MRLLSQWEAPTPKGPDALTDSAPTDHDAEGQGAASCTLCVCPRCRDRLERRAPRRKAVAAIVPREPCRCAGLDEPRRAAPCPERRQGRESGDVRSFARVLGASPRGSVDSSTRGSEWTSRKKDTKTHGPGLRGSKVRVAEIHRETADALTLLLEDGDRHAGRRRWAADLAQRVPSDPRGSIRHRRRGHKRRRLGAGSVTASQWTGRAAAPQSRLGSSEADRRVAEAAPSAPNAAPTSVAAPGMSHSAWMGKATG
jgi:hypothetical protein